MIHSTKKAYFPKLAASSKDVLILYNLEPKIGNCSTIGGIDRGIAKFFDV